MKRQEVQNTEIWEQLFLCDEDCARIRDFFMAEFSIERSYITRRMHITVYHALGPMPGVVAMSESANVILPAMDTRSWSWHRAARFLGPSSIRLIARWVLEFKSEVAQWRPSWNCIIASSNSSQRRCEGIVGRARETAAHLERVIFNRT